jgi:1-acyl-sn-glycerol-3-phosphate acyltransferase
VNWVRLISQAVIRSLTRTSFANLDRIPTQGALIVVANHASTIDPLLLFMSIQRDDVTFVGPGDFRLQFPANLAVNLPNIIRVKRSNQLEMASLKRMLEVLKQGHCLALFPEGGTWEKPLSEAKSGAAYLSMMTNAPIIPIGLGGTYQTWRDIARFQRPRLSVKVGDLLPAVPQPEKRAQREQLQLDATAQMMQSIYHLLPQSDQSRYDDLAHASYALHIAIRLPEVATPSVSDLPDGDVLGEILQKPNLMEPLIKIAKLPLTSLLTDRYHKSAEIVQSAQSLLDTLHGEFAGYMEYRLGETKSQRLYASLESLIKSLKHQTCDVALRPITRDDRHPSK